MANFEKKEITIKMPDGNDYRYPVLSNGTGQTYLPIGSADQLEKIGLKLPLTIADPMVRGIVIPTALSNVNGAEGRLSYRGYKIEDLVEKTSYEEVAHLLLLGDLPNQEQLSQFKGALAKNAEITPELQQQLIGALKAVKVTDKTDPMALMSTLVSVMDSNESLSVAKQADRYESTLRTIAVMPTLLGLVNARIKAGDTPDKLDGYRFPDTQDLGEGFSYAGLLMSALNQQPIQGLDAGKVAAFDKYLILHEEHGNNLSSFTARTVSSGETKKGGWRITLGAMQSLAGDLHGNASNEALENLMKIASRTEGTPAEKVAGYINDLGEKGKVPGMGHAIYKAPDPRSNALLNILEANKDGLKNPELYEIAAELKQQLAVHARFGAKEKGKPICPNVDFCAGVLLTQYLDIDPKLMTSMFAVGRNVGWHAHAAEHSRDTNSVIVRPEAIPLTPERDFVEMANRTPPTGISQGLAQLIPAANKFLGLAA